MKLFKILFLILLLKTHYTFSSISIVDKIAAIVNCHIILDSDIHKAMNITQQNFNNTIHTHNTWTYHTTLNQLISKHLILQTATKENIKINPKHIDQIITNISQFHNITINQFNTYLNNIHLNYKKYYETIYQEILKKTLCNKVVKQSLVITPDHINKITQQLSFINFNKKFNFKHIIINLPIQPSFDQIKESENLAKLLIQEKSIYNLQNLIHTYYNNNIFPIKISKNPKWGTWKDIPFIFDQYLQNTYPGEIIGPIHIFDEMHIIKIYDISDDNNTTPPIIKLKINSIIAKNQSNSSYIQQQLLQIKKQIENNDTTFTIVTQERSKDLYIENYDNSEGWVDLNDFDPAIQKSLLGLKLGHISMPIYTNKGWCLIKLIDINQINYTEIIQERAYSYMLYQIFNKTINNWIQDLKSISYIQITP